MAMIPSSTGGTAAAGASPAAAPAPAAGVRRTGPVAPPPRRRVTSAAPAAGLLAKMRADSIATARMFSPANTKKMERRVRGGASLVVFVLKKFEPKDGAYSQSFRVIVLNPRAGIEPDSDSSYIKDLVPGDDSTTEPGVECPSNGILLPVSNEMKEVSPEFFAQYPQKNRVRAIVPFDQLFMSIEMSQAANVVEKTVCVLSGVTAKALKPQSPTVDPTWRIFINCSGSKARDDMRDIAMMAATSSAEPSELSAPDLTLFDIGREKETRYGQDTVCVTMVPGATEADLMMSGTRALNAMRLVDPDTFMYKPPTGDMQMKAQLRFRVQQVVEGDNPGDEVKVETYYVGCDLWPENLAPFGLPDDAVRWSQLAPSIFENLKMTLLGTLDLKKTIENYGGLDEEEFQNIVPIHLNAIAFVPDVKRRYREIGVPVDADFAESTLDGGGGGASSTSGKVFEDSDVPVELVRLPGIVGLEDPMYKSRAGLIIAHAKSHPGSIKFRVIYGIRPTPAFYKCVRGMNVAEGTAFATYVAGNNGFGGDDDPALAALNDFPDSRDLVGNLAIGADTVCTTIAFLDDLLTGKAAQKRMEQIAEIIGATVDASAMTKAARAAPLAIESGASASASASASAAAAAAAVAPSSDTETTSEHSGKKRRSHGKDESTKSKKTSRKSVD